MFTTKAVGKGTGLGLSQIHGFAAQAAGRAEIESCVGQGTILRIYLPSTENPIPAPEPEHDVRELPHGLKVLLVEDNPQVRDFAAKLLEDMHCDVTTAEEGGEAIGLLRTGQFDLVFSDVVMPGVGGLELANQIEAERQNVPVLLATGYSDELLSGNANNFTVVPKPYDATSLRNSIASVLRRPCEQAVEAP